MSKFRKLVILDRIILSDDQWHQLRQLAEEVVEYSGLTPKQLMEKLAEEQGADPGAVCFTQLAVEQTTERELNERLAGADAVISCWTNLPDTVLRANPQLKYIGFWTNLVNHRVNLELAKELGITVTYIPDYGTIAVAEYTFALLMEMCRQTARQAKNTVRGQWPYELLKTSLYVPSVEAIPYRVLHGKKLGIIGFGRIGQQVARIALGYGMDVSYFSRQRQLDWENQGVTYRELDDILQSSNVVSIHLSPYAYTDPQGRISIDDHAPDCPENSPESKDAPIIPRAKLALLNNGAIFVNTSAGRLVDENALLDEAATGRIRVALDVYQSSPQRKRIQSIVRNMEQKGFGSEYHLFTYRGGWLTYESVLFKGDELIRHAETFLAQ